MVEIEQVVYILGSLYHIYDQRLDMEDTLFQFVNLFIDCYGGLHDITGMFTR